MMELSTLILQKFHFLFDVMSMERTFKMEAGTGSMSCHPSRCKMVVTSVDPALVVPCWWDQLTSLGGIIWLVARLENGTLGIWIHPVMPIFLESENSIINYVCRLKWLPCYAFLFYLITTVCYLFIWECDIDHCLIGMSWRRLFNKPKRRQKYFFCPHPGEFLVRRFFLNVFFHSLQLPRLHKSCSKRSIF